MHYIFSLPVNPVLNLDFPLSPQFAELRGKHFSLTKAQETTDWAGKMWLIDECTVDFKHLL